MINNNNNDNREKLIIALQEKVNAFKEDIYNALNQLGPAFILRRIFYPGITQARLSIVNDIYLRFYEIIKKVITFYPGELNKLDISSSSSTNISRCSIDSHVSKASEFVSKEVDKFSKEYSKPYHDKVAIIKFIQEIDNILNGNIELEISTPSAVQIYLNDYLLIVRDTIFYYALDARINNKPFMNEDKAYLDKLLNFSVIIVNKYFLELELSNRETSDNLSNFSTISSSQFRCSNWVAVTVPPSEELSSEHNTLNFNQEVERRALELNQAYEFDRLLKDFNKEKIATDCEMLEKQEVYCRDLLFSQEQDNFNGLINEYNGKKLEMQSKEEFKYIISCLAKGIAISKEFTTATALKIKQYNYEFKVIEKADESIIDTLGIKELVKISDKARHALSNRRTIG